MAQVIRVVTDIVTGEEVPQDTLDKISDNARQYAFGVIGELVVEDKDSAVNDRGAHVHVSTPQQACQFCYDQAVDLVK